MPNQRDTRMQTHQVSQRNRLKRSKPKRRQLKNGVRSRSMGLRHDGIHPGSTGIDSGRTIANSTKQTWQRILIENVVRHSDICEIGNSNEPIFFLKNHEKFCENYDEEPVYWYDMLWNRLWHRVLWDKSTAEKYLTSGVIDKIDQALRLPNKEAP